MVSGPHEERARRAVVGAASLAAGTLAAQVIGTIAGIVVARRIGPAAFGLFSIGAAVLAFAAVVRDLGLVPAILLRRLVEPGQLVSAHRALVLAGALLAGLVALASPVLGEFFREPAVVLVVAVSGLGLLVGAFSAVPAAVLQRDGRFGTVAFVIGGGQLLTAVLSVALAVGGAGVWALVLPPLVSGPVSSAVLWARSGLRGPGAPWRDLLPHVREGGRITGFALANQLTRWGDNVVVGRFFGEAELGLYAFAYNLLLRPLGLLTGSVSSALLPALSLLQSDAERFDRAVVRTAAGIARISFPWMLWAALVADDLVPVLFGAKWLAAVPMVRLFLVIGAVQTVSSLAGWVWLSTGHARLLSRWGAVTGVLSIGIFVGAASLGTVLHVALAYTCYSALLVLPSLWLTRRTCAVPLRGLGTALGRVLRDVAVALVATEALRLALEPLPVPAWARLVLAFLVGSVMYLGTFRLLQGAELAELVDVLPSRLQPLLRRSLALGGAPAAEKL